MEAKQTPLIELLEQVPQEARVVVEHDQFSSSSHPVGRLCHEAAVALRAALAEPVEPVAWGWRGADGQIRDCIAPDTHAAQEGGYTVPLYTAPPQRKPLTDEQVRDLWSWSMTPEAERTATTQQHAFARAIEAAHGIGGSDGS